MPTSALRKPKSDSVSETVQAAAGVRAFARIVERWHLSASDAMALLGVDSRSTYYEILKRARDSHELKGLTRDQLDRLSYLLGVYESLRILFPHNEEARDGWVSRANTSSMFAGKPPLETMRSGMVGLYQTFAHLAAARS